MPEEINKEEKTVTDTPVDYSKPIEFQDQDGKWKKAEYLGRVLFSYVGAYQHVVKVNNAQDLLTFADDGHGWIKNTRVRNVDTRIDLVAITVKKSVPGGGYQPHTYHVDEWAFSRLPQVGGYYNGHMIVQISKFKY